MDVFVTLLLGFFITAISYMGFPLLCILLNNGRFEIEMAKKIALWNSIIVGAIYLFLTVVLTDSTWRATQAVIYYWVNQGILTAKTKQRSNTMSNTENDQSEIQHSFSREEDRHPSVLTDHHRKPYLEELISKAAPTHQEPVNNDTPKAPTPSQEFLLREIQKKLKQQEISHLSQMYNEKLCRFKRNGKIRWVVTFCAFTLVYFGILMLGLDDPSIGLTLILAAIFTAIHFLINVSIFGWLIQKKIATERELDQMKKKIEQLEKSLNQ